MFYNACSKWRGKSTNGCFRRLTRDRKAALALACAFSLVRFASWPPEMDSLETIFLKRLIRRLLQYSIIAPEINFARRCHLISLDFQGKIFVDCNSWTARNVYWENWKYNKQNYYSFKIFPNSDWLKAHAEFPITSYWWPNLEEFCVYRGNDVKNAAFLQVNAPLTEKTSGRGWVVSVVKTKNGGHFTRFKSKN